MGLFIFPHYLQRVWNGEESKIQAVISVWERRDVLNFFVFFTQLYSFEHFLTRFIGLSF